MVSTVALREVLSLRGGGSLLLNPARSTGLPRGAKEDVRELVDCRLSAGLLGIRCELKDETEDERRDNE